MLTQDSREGLEWLSYPFHQHYIFIQLNGGVANNLINLVGRQPFRHDADYQAWLRRLARYPQLYSRVGFVHQFRPLSVSEMAGVLPVKWQQLSVPYDPADQLQQEAVALIMRTPGDLM